MRDVQTTTAIGWGREWEWDDDGCKRDGWEESGAENKRQKILLQNFRFQFSFQLPASSPSSTRGKGTLWRMQFLMPPCFPRQSSLNFSFGIGVWPWWLFKEIFTLKVTFDYPSPHEHFQILWDFSLLRELILNASVYLDSIRLYF